MKLETIFEQWKIDSDIDKTEISDEALKIPKLHHKYYMMFTAERILFRNLKEELKKLKIEKNEFFDSGPSEETKERGWDFPKKKILKSDYPQYIDVEPDVLELNRKIGYAEEKIELLDSIIKSINNRGYLLNTSVQWQKFISGG